MIILDTNIVAALMTDTPDSAVSAWLDRQPPSSVWITAITVFETRYGLNIMPVGRRKRRRETEFELMIGVNLQNRILSYDADAAGRAADLMAERRRIGRSIDLRDTMIAGIALSQNATLATRYVWHFDDLDVPVIDPWNA